MTKAEVRQALDMAIEEEGQAIKKYQRLADDMRAWVNTIRFPI